ncbi:MAG: response regulator transcription factor [Bacteroidia bacterium]|nr:response regulator transcription factor [Bacteroidota bacterium]MBP9082068.1 response regulator transcription factor [Bacteroidia bacterium]MBK7389714.1 response regulator transcription factor [Bacteroidota bacterium]MBK7970130.1 response regulator transcription factor [Bacteroidota bacterium]MBK8874069.1 response regulator transcription factor [Bacteroidota bacterium]
MKILIADDHAFVRKGIRQIITEEFSDATISEACDSTELLQMVRSEQFSVVISDLSMPGKNALEILKDLKAEEIKTPVIILSMHPEDQYALRVLKAGGSGYLTKESAPEELVKAIRMVLSGKRYISAAVAEQLLIHIDDNSEVALHQKLSDREFTVFKLIATGKTVSQIADMLFLSVPTISTYRTRILEKTGLRTNAEITRYAILHQLV